MMSNGELEGGREPMKQKKRNDNEETVVELVETRRQVKIIVK